MKVHLQNRHYPKQLSMRLQSKETKHQKDPRDKAWFKPGRIW
jgi:hypothetical protein